MLQTQSTPLASTSPYTAERHSDQKANSGSSVSPAVVAGSVRAIEASVVAALGFGFSALLFEAADTVAIVHGLMAAAAGALASTLVAVCGLHSLPALRNPGRALPRLLGITMLAMTVVVAAASTLGIGGQYTLDFLVAWSMACALALSVGRLMVAAKISGWSNSGRLNRRAVIYGSGPACAALVAALEADRDTDIRICGIYDDRGGDRVGEDVNGYPTCGRLDDLLRFARASRVDLVLLALPISAENRLMDLLQKLWVLPADIRLVASASRLKLARRAYSYVGNVALVALADKPISDWGQIAKVAFDTCVAALALIALSPIMLLTAIAIRLDSKGPALFRQKRYGFNNELIEVYKFRSMYTEKTDHSATKLVTRDDRRVTRVGRFIRRSSIDELPQLFNVLKGQLSMVGPRPHAVSAKAAGKLYDEAVDSYFARHKVKPGITGWAQINGWRGETDTEEKLVKRIEHDLEYIENWSLPLDIKILLRTPMSLLKTENAY